MLPREQRINTMPKRRHHKTLEPKPYQNLRDHEPNLFNRVFMNRFEYLLYSAPRKTELIPGEHYAVGRIPSNQTILFIHKDTGLFVAGDDRKIHIGPKMIEYHGWELNVMDILMDMNAFVRIMVKENNDIEALGIVKPIETEFNSFKNIFIIDWLMGKRVVSGSRDIHPSKYGQKLGFIYDMEAVHECDDPYCECDDDIHSWNDVKSGDYYILGSLLTCEQLCTYVIYDNQLLMMDGIKLKPLWNIQLGYGFSFLAAMIYDDSMVKVSWDVDTGMTDPCWMPITYNLGKKFEYKGKLAAFNG